jgi:serine/threonine-protein kinase GIN4
MEYFKGDQLCSFIQNNGPLSESRALKCIKSLVECVDKLHLLGIAHRDIKPQNVLINHEFELKLIDFNISKKGKNNTLSCKFSKRFMTQVSSPLFAAPEILSPDFYTESVDIWGIGIILVTMLFGMQIFEHTDNLNNEKNFSTFIGFVDKSNVTDGMKELIKMTLVYDQDERATATELLNFLEDQELSFTSIGSKVLSL